MEKKKVSFVQGAAILGIAGLIVKVIGAAFRIPLANTIGLIGTSYYDTAYPYYSWLLVISSSGLPTAISKMVSERVTLGDYRGAHRVFTTAMQILCCIGLLTSILMFFGSDYIARLHMLPEAAYCFKALAPALFFVALMCAYRGYMQGMQQMVPTAISQVVEQVGKLAVGLTLAFMLLDAGPEYAAMGALIGVTVSELLALIYVMLSYRRRWPKIRARLERSVRREAEPVAARLMAIALPITIGASISPLASVVDSALIIRILLKLGYAKETAQTAFSLMRTNVATLTNMPGVLTMALAMSLVPAISAFSAKRDHAGIQDTARLGLKLALIIGLPCAVGLFVLASPILAMLYPNLTEGRADLGGGPDAHLLHRGDLPFLGAVHDRRHPRHGQAQCAGVQPVHWVCLEGGLPVGPDEHPPDQHPGRRCFYGGLLRLCRHCGYHLCDPQGQAPLGPGGRPA